MSASTASPNADGSNAAGSNKVPREECDLIMKGGITSGIVYPKLIARLSNDYRFRCIGGTSAGAIAAAACAAAEFGRSTGMNPRAFDQLAELPKTLGALSGDPPASKLFHLFQPAPALQQHFAVLQGALNAPNPLSAVAKALRAVLWQFWGSALLAVLFVVVVLSPAVMQSGRATTLRDAALYSLGVVAVWSIGLAIILRFAVWHRTTVPQKAVIALLVVGALLWATWWKAGWIVMVVALFSMPIALCLAGVLSGVRFASTLVRRLHGNFYGICSGRTDDPARKSDALTDWLTKYLDELAGRKSAERPLTFSDLWNSDGELAGDRAIDLQVVTSAVSQQMCYSIPFRPNAGLFFYDPVEWARLFPESVMKWLDEAPRTNQEERRPVFRETGTKASRERAGSGRVLRELPASEHLPVVVATRMSLSFPVLLSAIPLYAIDYSIGPDDVKRVWFSDGGISSNLPLHFFDSPLPRRPTFAVNLKREHPKYPIDPNKKASEQEGRVYLPRNNDGGHVRWWAAPSNVASKGFVEFLVGIVNTMQNWRDEIQFPYPGFRDRIVQVSQLPKEGGLNLNMPFENITRLSDAGEHAGERLVNRFHPDSTALERGGWDNHKRYRLRTFLGLCEDLLRHPNLRDMDWDTVVDAIVPKDYSQRDAEWAHHVLRTLRELGQGAEARGRALADKSPKPRPTMRIAPRI